MAKIRNDREWRDAMAGIGHLALSMDKAVTGRTTPRAIAFVEALEAADNERTSEVYAAGMRLVVEVGGDLDPEQQREFGALADGSPDPEYDQCGEHYTIAGQRFVDVMIGSCSGYMLGLNHAAEALGGEDVAGGDGSPVGVSECGYPLVRWVLGDVPYVLIRVERVVGSTAAVRVSCGGGAGYGAAEDDIVSVVNVMEKALAAVKVRPPVQGRVERPVGSDGGEAVAQMFMDALKDVLGDDVFRKIDEEYRTSQASGSGPSTEAPYGVPDQGGDTPPRQAPAGPAVGDDGGTSDGGSQAGSDGGVDVDPGGESPDAGDARLTD